MKNIYLHGFYFIVPTEKSQEIVSKLPEDASTESVATVPPPTAHPKATMRLTYEDYKHMANLLVLHMRKNEEESG